MALIECNECGSEISDKADACPKCGNPLRKRSRKEKPQQIRVKTEAGCGTAFMAIIVFFLAAVIGTAILNSFF